jgi:hypothetical protein
MSASISADRYWGVGWPWVYGYPYEYSAYYPYPAAVATDPPVYLDPEPAPATTTPAATSYWYYCTEPAGYYPYVQRCSKAWMPVVPQNVPPDVNPSPSLQ